MKHFHFEHAMRAFDEISREQAAKLLNKNPEEAPVFIFIGRDCRKKQKKRKGKKCTDTA